MAESVPPERSLEQRRAGLARANEIRTYRAHLKRDLKAGHRSIDSLLTSPPDEILTAKVVNLLFAVPKYGRVKITKILTQCEISPSKTIGGLSPRQRAELANLLGGRSEPARPPRSEPVRRPLPAPAGATHLLQPATATAACGRAVDEAVLTLDLGRVTCRTCRNTGTARVRAVEHRGESAAA